MGVGGFEELAGELIMERLRAICDEATPDQFSNRLELSTVVRSYILKRFVERFPEEYHAWARHEHPERRPAPGEGADRLDACGEHTSSKAFSTADRRLG